VPVECVVPESVSATPNDSQRLGHMAPHAQSHSTASAHGPHAGHMPVQRCADGAHAHARSIPNDVTDELPALSPSSLLVGGVESRRVESSRVESSRVESSRVESSRVESSQFITASWLGRARPKRQRASRPLFRPRSVLSPLTKWGTARSDECPWAH